MSGLGVEVVNVWRCAAHESAPVDREPSGRCADADDEMCRWVDLGAMPKPLFAAVTGRVVKRP
jgi:hypothetical protein